MPLPQIVEIIPPVRPVHAEITVPGSKSVTNRALVLAALAAGDTLLRGALWSEDTQVMVNCLQTLGFEVEVTPEPDEPCNRRIRVVGQGGRVPRGGSDAMPIELFVGNAGTAARFLSALVCLGEGIYRLQGVARMHERPQAALFSALRQLGYTVESVNNRLPAIICGTGPRQGRCEVSIAESSQFASALLLCARVGRWQIEVTGSNRDESPYVEMTRQLLKQFPDAGGTFAIEADASSGSYFVAAGWLLESGRKLKQADRPGAAPEFGVRVRGWPATDWQIDAAFPKFWPLPETVSRERDLGDSIMTAIVMAPFAGHPVRFTELGRLRVQECERVAALRTELSKCGGRVEEQGDTLRVYPSGLHGAAIETYNDHRMAMCFSILGLKVPGIKIINPACVKKTFPNFFQKLAGRSPDGLGVRIMDATRGAELGSPELFAD